MMRWPLVWRSTMEREVASQAHNAATERDCARVYRNALIESEKRLRAAIMERDAALAALAPFKAKRPRDERGEFVRDGA